MTISEEKMSLAKEILKELDNMESLRRENQYKDVLQSFRKNIKEGNGLTLFYYAILYDEVREQLEREGFRVRVITSNSRGTPAYVVSKREDFVINDDTIEKNLL